MDGVELRVRRGEVFGFLGPNGAGKIAAVLLVSLVGAAERRLEIIDTC